MRGRPKINQPLCKFKSITCILSHITTPNEFSTVLAFLFLWKLQGYRQIEYLSQILDTTEV